MTQEQTPTSPEETPEIETPTPNQEPVIPEKTEPENPENPAATQPNPEDSVEYWKKRHAESTREAQILLEKNKQSDARIAELTKPHSPTDSELRQEYPEWDSMLPHEKKLATDNLAMKRELTATKSTTAQILAEKAWEKDLKTTLKKFPGLKGKEEEFEAFVFKPTHQGVSVEVLAKSFLFDTSTPPAPTPKAAPTGERSSGGTPPGPAKKKYSAEQMRDLRKSDYRKYKEIVDSGEYEEEL